jgi:hypothetical protein
MRVDKARITRAAQVATALGLAGFLLAPVAATASSGTKLKGVFDITAGQCTSSGAVTSGSYFEMLTPGGVGVANTSSPCGTDTETPLAPGTSGGLSTKAYQPNPNPEFDSSGNGLANLITQPAEFEGVYFAESTNPTDPQTATAVKKPKIIDTNGALSGNLSAWSVGWNNLNFNQGAPKPTGAAGTTTGPTGTYNATTKVYTLTWQSEISGGPFNGFTGVWFLTGKFKAVS